MDIAMTNASYPRIEKQLSMQTLIILFPSMCFLRETDKKDQSSKIIKASQMQVVKTKWYK